jgi:AraC-like DNA-binding protein
MELATLAPDFHDHGAGLAIELHAHEQAQVLVAIEGRMQVQLGPRRVVIDPRRAVWIPPGVPHAALAIERTAFRGLYVDRANASLLPGRACSFDASPLLVAALPELTAARARRRGLAASLLLDELFVRLAPAPAPADPRLAALCARIVEDPAAAPDLDAAARSMATSRRSFSRSFRAATHKSWSAWVREVRLARAAALLAGGARVSDAALAVGYATPSSFSTAFRAWAGASPATRRGNRDHDP